MINASAVLYPYLRSLVSLLSTQFDSEKIILPLMNFYEVIKDVGYDQIFLISESFEPFE